MVGEQIGKQSFLKISEAKERFDEIVARVENGETIRILREGRVVAELSPGTERPFDRENAEEVVADFRKERATWAKVKVTRDEILAWRHEGHRV